MNNSRGSPGCLSVYQYIYISFDIGITTSPDLEVMAIFNDVVFVN